MNGGIVPANRQPRPAWRRAWWPRAGHRFRTGFAAVGACLREGLDGTTQLSPEFATAAVRLAARRRGRGGVVADLRRDGAVRAHPAADRFGLRSQLSVGARDQRPDHRHPALRPVPHVPVARPAAAGRRLPVHRPDGDRAWADLSRTVRADRAARRRTADDRLALHVLARRISADGHRLCGIQARRRAGRRDASVGRDRRERRRGRRRGRRARADRDPRAGRAAADHAGQCLYAGDDRCRLVDLGAQSRRARGPLVSPPAFGARPLAHGRDVRLARRHRARGGAQRRPLRPRFLRREGLRSRRRELRARGAAARDRRALYAARRDVRGRAPARGGRDLARQRPAQDAARFLAAADLQPRRRRPRRHLERGGGTHLRLRRRRCDRPDLRGAAGKRRQCLRDRASARHGGRAGAGPADALGPSRRTGARGGAFRRAGPRHRRARPRRRLHLGGRHRAAQARAAARAIAEDGGSRPADRRGGARFQQHPHGDHRHDRDPRRRASPTGRSSPPSRG